MRTVLFASTFSLLTILISVNCFGQQPTQIQDRLTASTTVTSTPQASMDPLLELLFDPTSLPSEPSAAGSIRSSIPNVPTVAFAGLSPAKSSTRSSPTTVPASSPIGERPRVDSRKSFVITNSAMYAATVFDAWGRRSEVSNCVRESHGLQNGVYAAGVYQGQAPGTQAQFYAIALPIDGAVTLLSALARHKGWRRFEIVGPVSAASAHIAAGVFRFTAGCY